jgi:SAM-dependent methyltransferase
MSGFFTCQAPRLAQWLYRELSSCGETLDIGCGDKWYYKYLKPNGLIAVDAWERAEPDIVLDVGENPLPFPDLHFDTVIMLDIIEHMEKDKGRFALSEAQRTCKDRIVLLTPVIWDDNGDTKNEFHKPNPYRFHKSLWTGKDFLREDGWQQIGGVMSRKYYFGQWRRSSIAS